MLRRAVVANRRFRRDWKLVLDTSYEQQGIPPPACAEDVAPLNESNHSLSAVGTMSTLSGDPWWGFAFGVRGLGEVGG